MSPVLAQRKTGMRTAILPLLITVSTVVCADERDRTSISGITPAPNDPSIGWPADREQVERIERNCVRHALRRLFC
jgi:hypothetical protein